MITFVCNLQQISLQEKVIFAALQCKNEINFATPVTVCFAQKKFNCTLAQSQKLKHLSYFYRVDNSPNGELIINDSIFNGILYRKA